MIKLNDQSTDCADMSPRLPHWESPGSPHPDLHIEGAIKQYTLRSRTPQVTDGTPQGTQSNH